MKKYEVREQYAESWFWDQEPTALSEDEVQRLAKEWNLTEDDLREQLIEIAE